MMKRARTADPSEDRPPARGSSNLNKRKRRKGTIEVGGVRIRNPWQPHVHVPSRKLNGVDIYFDDLERHLAEKIETFGRNHVVVGCVAWVTNTRVLAALAKCRRVLLLINDEAYARWGGGKCRHLYKALPGLGGAEPTPASVFGHFPNMLQHLDTPGYETVRAVGANTRSLMHCKYLVFFADYAEGELPAAVWAGSMNHTKQATHNLENTLFIDSPDAALAYFHDFANTFYESLPMRD